jgi:hypothetical protein
VEDEDAKEDEELTRSVEDDSEFKEEEEEDLPIKPSKLIVEVKRSHRGVWGC